MVELGFCESCLSVGPAAMTTSLLARLLLALLPLADDTLLRALLWRRLTSYTVVDVDRPAAPPEYRPITLTCINHARANNN